MSRICLPRGVVAIELKETIIAALVNNDRTDRFAKLFDPLLPRKPLQPPT
jgi:hypothetical protein